MPIVIMPRSPTNTTRLKANLLVQILDHFQHRGLIQTIAGEDMMGNRPSIHHHHPDDDLPVAWSSVATVAELAQLRRASSFEVRRSNVVEDQVRLQAE